MRDSVNYDAVSQTFYEPIAYCGDPSRAFEVTTPCISSATQ